MTFFEFNIWWRCATGTAAAGSAFSHWTREAYTFTVLLTLLGTVTGFALVHLVQAVVPLATRRHLLHFNHFAGPCVWLLPFLACSGWTVLPIFANVRSGSTPHRWGWVGFARQRAPSSDAGSCRAAQPPTLPLHPSPRTV
jgi:hypothetical protein